jgi:hypothetical protein
MPSYFERIVEEMGLKKAKQHMAEIRKKRKTPGYFSTLSREELQALQRKGTKKYKQNQKGAKGAEDKDRQSGSPV